MRVVAAHRASAILFDLARDHRDARPWLLPANACPVLALALLAAGRDIRLADLDPADHALDRDRAVSLAAAHQLGAVVFVRPFGRLSAEHAFFEALRAADPACLRVDDRCLCDPVFEDVSESASVTVVSTGYGKPIDLGGGALALLDPDTRFEASASPVFSVEALRDVENLWRAAAAAGTTMPPPGETWLDRRSPVRSVVELQRRIEDRLVEARRHRALLTGIYRREVPEEAQLPPDCHTWRFQLTVDDAASLVEQIFGAGLFASRHHAVIAPQLGIDGRFPVAEALARRIVNLFNDAHYTAGMAERTGAIVRRHLESKPAGGPS